MSELRGCINGAGLRNLAPTSSVSLLRWDVARCLLVIPSGFSQMWDGNVAAAALPLLPDRSGSVLLTLSALLWCSIPCLPSGPAGCPPPVCHSGVSPPHAFCLPCCGQLLSCWKQFPDWVSHLLLLVMASTSTFGYLKEQARMLLILALCSVYTEPV